MVSHSKNLDNRVSCYPDRLNMFDYGRSLIHYTRFVYFLGHIISVIVTLWSSSFKGQATDIQIQAEEISKLKKQLNTIYSTHCDKPLDFIGKYE